MCQYAGEVISTAEARRRLAQYDSLPDTAAGHALLVRPPAAAVHACACAPVTKRSTRQHCLMVIDRAHAQADLRRHECQLGVMAG